VYENLPEEGGKKNTTGGKMEEAVLKSIKGTLDILCLQLSDPLFDLVLRLVYEYGTTNARSNAVRAFGQLVACLARVQPEKTIAKFLPFCTSQIKEELKHGASSIRTTSTHAAVPSDTTLHWSTYLALGLMFTNTHFSSSRYVYSARLSRIWRSRGEIHPHFHISQQTECIHL
jgi:proteasome activator subunit 4